MFKKTVCVWAPGDCCQCRLRHSCSYSYVFETAPPPESQKLRTWNQVPRPYIIEPPNVPPGRPTRIAGQPFDFHIVLVGRGIDYLPYFIFSFAELGRIGFGAGRGKYNIPEVYTDAVDGRHLVYSESDRTVRLHGNCVTGSRLLDEEVVARLSRDGAMVAIEFLTPTRIRNDDRVQSDLTFQDLIRALLRRLSSLCYFHCGCELDIDFRQLIDRAVGVRTVQSNLQWKDQQRFSGRQKQHVRMGGVVGTVTFAAEDPSLWEPYLFLLAAGQWVHVGKGAVMGLGQYRWHVAER